MELLNGKTAVVTGGTRGIGLAIVRVFLQNGAKVALCGSRMETAEKAVTALKAENADWPVIGLAPDLTDFNAVQAAIQTACETFGGVDILVNNAGISAREPLAAYKPEDFKKIMDLNVTAVFNGCKAVEPLMRKAGHGCIISTSSMVSLYGQPSGVGYPASKFAVNGLTKSLARELGPAGIRVTPGRIWSPRCRRSWPRAFPPLSRFGASESRRRSQTCSSSLQATLQAM